LKTKDLSEWNESKRDSECFEMDEEEKEKRKVIAIKSRRDTRG
jgi:hypothetical protein